MFALRRDLIGRDEQVALLADFVAGVDRLPRALILEGGAGIGKTELWATGIDLAEAAGIRRSRSAACRG